MEAWLIDTDFVNYWTASRLVLDGQVLDLFYQLVAVARAAGQDIQDHQPQIAMAEKARSAPAAVVFVSHSSSLNLIYLNYI